MVKAKRPVVAMIAVTLLVVVVALASRPLTGAAPAVGTAVTRTVLDAVFYLFVSLSLVEGLILLWLLWPHEDLGPGPRLDKRRHSLLAALLLAVTLVLLVRSRGGHLGTLPLFGVRPPSVGVPPATARLSGGRGVTALGMDWPAIAVAALVMVAVAVLGWRLLRAPSRHLRVVRSPGPKLESVLDDAIGEATAEADPRRAVVVAWARVERLLAEHDAGRRPFEAPFEYAVRAAAAVGLDAGALERLAGLYEWARFSVNEVTTAMRRDAIEGLTEVRERLRLV
jgi:hypothetical protein